MHWILGIALAAGLFVVLRKWGTLSLEKKKRPPGSHSYRRWRAVAADGADWAHSRFNSRCCRFAAFAEKLPALLNTCL